jgi:hypothetical protein
MAKPITLPEIEAGISTLRAAKDFMCALAGDTSHEWLAWDEVGATALEVVLQRSIVLRNRLIGAPLSTDAT